MRTVYYDALCSSVAEFEYRAARGENVLTEAQKAALEAAGVLCLIRQPPIVDSQRMLVREIDLDAPTENEVMAKADRFLCLLLILACAALGAAFFKGALLGFLNIFNP